MKKIKRKRNEKNIMFIKLIVVCILFVFGFTILFGRLVNLQIVNANFYAARAVQQQFSEQMIPAQRGSIYDRNMTPLAESATAWDVAVSPAYIKGETQRNAIADNLSKILGINRDTLYKQINNQSKYVVISKQIPKPQADAITQFMKKKNIGCIGLTQDSKRYYPFGNFASQLIGFTGSDGQGLAGVEAQYDSVLKGIPGKSVAERTPNGEDMPYNTGEYVAAQNGNNLVLTIDETVQQALESNLQKALTDNNVTNRVTGIVMNVKNGEILGMATAPGYDLNNPYTVVDSTVQKQLSALTGTELKTATSQALQTQWKNKAISEPYEPGSTFKIITASGGLEEGVVHENDMFDDSGSITVSGTTFHDWNNGYGQVTFLKGFEQSINVVFIEVGQRLGITNFYKYVSDFGLTDKTGIDLPGETNSITIPKDKYGPVELASSAFGQSNKFTAVQLITAVAAAANGGYLVQPHVVREIIDASGNVVKTFSTNVKRQVISTETSQEMDKILEMEVSEGSGKNAYVAGYRIGGKTGTAQKLDSKDPTARVAEFAGVAPSDDPQYAVLFMMDEPHNPVSNYGGVIASPVVGNIFSEILPYLGVEPQYTAAELAKLAIKTPNLTGRTVTDASNLLKGQGLSVKVQGSGQTVTAQSPASGEAIPRNGTIMLYTDGAAIQQTVSVPSLSGMTPAQVSQTLTAAGLNANLTGASLTDTGEAAYEQDVAAGTKVAPGAVVTVKFRNNNITVQ
ncbi:penicillin-binding transpeptidase domain-containing protein [Ethanoligenens sp.]|uniref:penicillin-binding transpeptidase domain-containing protein n=1 Tax=Ethanoligenens sp. TaxID=2099655 RepID=UPI0039EBA18C